MSPSYLPHSDGSVLHRGCGGRFDRNHGLRGMAVGIHVLVLLVVVFVIRGDVGRLVVGLDLLEVIEGGLGDLGRRLLHEVDGGDRLGCGCSLV